MPTYSKKRDELVLGTSGRLVDAFYHELALEASNDLSPPTREEQAANAELAESFARLKAMAPDERFVRRAHTGSRAPSS